MNGRYVQLLGAPRVKSGDCDVPRFRSQRTVALLGYLAAERRPVARDFLSALFWPDEPATTARANLRRELHNLSRILPACWETDRLAVQFIPSSDTAIDLWHFLDLEQAKKWDEAAELVQGDFLEGVYLDDNLEFESWLLGQRERWRQRAETVLTQLIEQQSRQAHYNEALRYARRLLRLTPWNEAVHRQVMRLLSWTDQRAAALRQYQLCVDILETELGVPPDPETIQLYDEIREGNAQCPPSATAGPSQRRHNLPAQTTPFIGRDQELTELSRLLHEPATRLITVFGPGGMGKTRLALAAAQQHLSRTQDRVGFVDLAPLAPGDDMIPAIAEAVGYPFQQDERSPKQQLLDYVRTKQLLLLLDNFEHMLEQVGLVHEILQAGPQVKVLVTSRERLKLSGETVLTLAGMAFPELGTTADAPNYHAVQLFIQGANRLRPDLTLGVDDLAAITRICRLVQGMPLAILLAAAWIDLLSPREIAEEIAKSLDFLATDLHDVPDRQRSIQAIFEYSWRRLTERERSVFMKLAVFRGGFTREAAQAVAGASLKSLSSLVNQALLQPQRNGRYTLHELLRQYAEDKLASTGQTAEVHTDHATYYSNFLHEREADIKGRRQLAALDEIEADFENVRAAWQWAVHQRNYEATGRALESLRWYCHIRSRFQEIQVLLDMAQEILTPAQGKQPHPIWGRLQAGAIKVQSSHLELSDDYQNQVKIALAISQKHAQRSDCAFCLWRLGVIAYRLNNVDEALVYFKESTRYYHSLADDFYLSYVLKDMALLYIRLDLPDKGISLLEQSIDLHSKLGDRVGLAPALGAMGWISYYSARYAESQAHWQEVQQISTLYGNRTQQLWNLSGQGWKALFTDGDMITVQTMAEELQCGGLDLNDLECQHRAQILFGLLAGIQEDYSTCRRAFSNDPNRHPFPYNRAWTLIGLCVAACGLHDAQAICNNLYKLLEDSHTHHWLANYAIALPFAAVLADNTDQPERAAELLGLAYHHPLSPKGWLHCWPLLARLKAELESGLGPDVFAAAWARGATLDLEVTAETLLAQLREDRR